MYHASVENTFESWRAAARRLFADRIPPSEVVWSPESQGGLFSTERVETKTPHDAGMTNVPKAFLDLARVVACYDDAEKWALLYRILWRISTRGRELLEIDSDPDMRLARVMEKAVRRDIHKFHAFVRFRKIDCEGQEIFGAWHEPQHFCVELATPFFARRFGAMKFSIFTPKGCAHWDLKSLTFSAPAEKKDAPAGDEMEDFWLLYYRSIYNPFRLKVNAMKREFPVRHWPTLPEAVLIPELIREAQN